MKGKTTRKLRKATGFKPKDERFYVQETTHKIVRFPGQPPTMIERITVKNDESSARAMYQKAKKLAKNKDYEIV